MAEDLAAWTAATLAASGDLQQALATHRAELSRIQRQSLAHDQKPREIAASYRAAAVRVADLKRSDAAAISQAADQAETRAFAPQAAEFGHASRIDDTRTAYDRTEKVKTPAAAHALLDQAETEKDHSLGRITALHAHRQALAASTPDAKRNWGGVVTRWAESQPPAVRGHLDDWEQGTRLLQSRAAVVARGMAYRVPVPAEISGLSSGQIQQLAAQAMGRYGGPTWG